MALVVRSSINISSIGKLKIVGANRLKVHSINALQGHGHRTERVDSVTRHASSHAVSAISVFAIFAYSCVILPNYVLANRVTYQAACLEVD